ncbi:MAG: hypothetical protein GY725_16075 [bacterium]|nr:hypothetical protein [bacterium]
MLALEYLFGRPAGVASLVLASSLCSTSFWAEETHRLRQGLPDSVQATMQRFEKSFHQAEPRRGSDRPGLSAETMKRRGRLIAITAGLMSGAVGQRIAGLASRLPFLRAAAYQIAGLAFLRQHVYRLDPAPDVLFDGIAGFNTELYEAMWGPSDFFATGSLANWDVEERLAEIDVPTLITSGRFDEATPTHMERIRNGIPDSRWVCFEQSSHSAFLEEPERYRTVLEDFLVEVEDRKSGPSLSVRGRSS